MTKGREVTAVLLFAVAFLITQFNPVSLNFSWNTLIGLAFVALFGALVTVAGMIEVRWHYLAPILLLSVFDLSAVGLFLFAALGVKAADHEEENMITPKVMSINSAAFSSYTLFVLAAVLASYSAIQFQIPGVVSGFAVELLPLPEGCRLGYTGQECLEVQVNEDIANYCGSDQACLAMQNQNRDLIEDAKLRDLSASYVGFSREKTMRQILQETLNAQIMFMIEPYEGVFRFVMAFVIFSTFQVLSSPLVLVATVFSKLILAAMERADLLTKKFIKVEKLRFSA